ncbi:MAG: hypothetical protein IJU76_04140 [Desulfovibrionaceae bacterium]|nr:hypothetical protein [Desulfovibrionaceae bacterium]
MIYIVRCILETKTPLHCGEASDGLLDAPVIRDAFGLWRIPGSTIAGVFRSWIRRHRPEAETQLFGSERDSEQSSSKLWVSDGQLLDFDNTLAWRKAINGTQVDIPVNQYIRDHVRLDPETGAAAETGKFDEEYVPKGVRFFCEITLDEWFQAHDDSLLAAFGDLMAAFLSGELRFGASQAYNYGTYTVIQTWARSFDLTREASTEAWLSLDDTETFPQNVGEPWSPTANPMTPESDLYGTLTIPLRAQGPILIAGGEAEGAIDTDLCFAKTAVYDYQKKTVYTVFAIPGSALRGAIRHRVHAILGDLSCGTHIEDDLFGALVDKEAKRGKIAFADAILFAQTKPLDETACKTVQHVSIDRFTGGAMDAQLFNEAPLWRDDICLDCTLTLDGIAPEAAGILLHALCDLAESALPIGNGVNRGNGRLALDRERAIRCDLVWNGETLNEKDTEKAQIWLKRINDACKETFHAHAV